MVLAHFDDDDEEEEEGLVKMIIILAREEVRRQLHKNAEGNIEPVLAATPHKAPNIRPPASHHEPDKQDTAGEAGRSS